MEGFDIILKIFIMFAMRNISILRFFRKDFLINYYSLGVVSLDSFHLGGWCVSQHRGSYALFLLIINFFLMRNTENKFVTPTVMVAVTPAQAQLLEILDPANSADYADALRAVHELGTYNVDFDMVNLSASGKTHHLLDAIRAIANEPISNPLKTA